VTDTLARLRQTFATGKTLPIEWRLAQLGEIDRMLREHEKDFQEALQLDLGKCHFESTMTEINFVQSEVKHARRHLASWMRAQRVRTPIMAQPGRSYIRPEPKGVVLIIAPWNYPLSMVTAPLVGAVAAGNCAVMKPSEVTSHTSAAIASILPRYLDNDAFAVVEGGIPETTELLEQRFDHVLYTGNERVAKIVMAAAARHLTPVTLELGQPSVGQADPFEVQREDAATEDVADRLVHAVRHLRRWAVAGGSYAHPPARRVALHEDRGCGHNRPLHPVADPLEYPS
jgi:aldehyde dehydrogenase (NAD+)